MPQAPSKKTTGPFNTSDKSLHSAVTFSYVLEAKVVALSKPAGKGPKFPKNLRPISLLPSTSKVFERVILQIVKRHIGENNLLNASQFGFRDVTARHCNA
jgi:hypothetical protein